MPRDYCKVLNVKPDATPEEIQKAYRNLALRYHPDRNRSNSANWFMATINEAYETLGEERKRSAYGNQRFMDDNPVDNLLLRAAHDRLVQSKWSVIEDSGKEVLLRNGHRHAHVFLVPSLNVTTLPVYRKIAIAFSVVLALRIGASLDVSSDAMAVVDLMRSRLHGRFPDDTYKKLFESFLL